MPPGYNRGAVLLLLASLLQHPAPFIATDLSASPQAVLRPVPAGDVTLHDGFWLDRVHANRQSLRAGHAQLERIGAFENFRVAAGEDGRHQVFVFTDSDAYKWLEAACIEIALRGGDEELRRQVADFVPLILAAMQPDGYVMTKYTIERLPRWQNLAHDHELYCLGHLIQAGIAHRRAFGDSEFFRRVCASADLIARTFPGEREGACGHPEIELALVELYRATGARRHLDTAVYFLDRRGVQPFVAGGADYMQDHRPFREQREAVGHAVRASYLYAGAADVYLETGDPSLPPALHDLWNDLYYYKTYVTGGVGARHDGEAIGARYELPNREAYSETCAAIAAQLFHQRMLCLTGEAKYGDAMETALYNNILAAVSLDGNQFFYVNPLESAGGHQRRDWYDCACCPPNIMRTIANIGGQFFLARENTLYANVYGACEVDTRLPGGQRAHFRVATELPSGSQIVFEPLPGNECTRLALRVPDWMRSVHGEAGTNFALDPATRWGMLQLASPAATAAVSFALEPELILAHPANEAARGKGALRLGPLMYCLESVDNPMAPNTGVDPIDAAVLPYRELPGSAVETVALPALPVKGIQGLSILGHMVPAAGSDPPPAREHPYRRFGTALTEPFPPQIERIALHAIPYFCWANRGDSRMRIWLPLIP